MQLLKDWKCWEGSELRKPPSFMNSPSIKHTIGSLGVNHRQNGWVAKHLQKWNSLPAWASNQLFLHQSQLVTKVSKRSNSYFWAWNADYAILCVLWQKMCCKVIEIVLNNLLLQSAMLLQYSVLETLNEAIVGCLASLLIWLLLLPGASPHTVCCHVTLGHLTNTNTNTKTNANTNKTQYTNAKVGYCYRT